MDSARGSRTDEASTPIRSDAAPRADAGATRASAPRNDAGAEIDAGLAPGASVPTNSADDLTDAAVTADDAGSAGAVGTPGAPSVQHAIDCTRPGLSALVSAYFRALEAHDPTRLPLSANVRFTENAQPIALGEGLWQSAGTLMFQRNALDTERCSTMTEAVIGQPGSALLIGVRLKLVAGQLTESETYLPVTPATTGGGLGALPGLVNSANDDWEGALAPARRSTREQLNAVADDYFDSISDPKVVPPFGSPCTQVINGAEISMQQSCLSLYVPLPLIPGLPRINASPTHRRYPVADLEAGIAVGFGIIVENTLSFHMFKVIDGKIRFVNTVTGGNATTTGWEE